MMNKPFLISICMIVKDEEKNIRRCLNSLKPLLDCPNIELIIVDTGSTDKTVEIVKQYTERVYFHEWNNSFSEMRNISISYATGEWIFIIDADEELQDVEKLMDLMESESVRNYNAIKLQEKNILSLVVDRAVYHVTERLFRNDGSFKYVGTVHNQAIYQHPVMQTDIFLIHYGYINEDEDLMEKKFIRTSALLLKELENNPDHIYYRFQLARTYMMHKDNKEAIEEIRKAYDVIKKRNLNRTEYYYVYGEYIRLAICNNEYEEAIRIGLEGINAKPDYIDVYYFTACSYVANNKKEDAVPLFKAYFEMYSNYTSGKMDLTRYNAVELYTIDSAARSNAAFILTNYYCEKEEYDKAVEYIDLIDEHVDKYKLVIKVYIRLERYCGLLDYYNNNIPTDESKLTFIQLLELFRKEMEVDAKTKLAEQFATGNDQYSQLNQIRVSLGPAGLIRTFLQSTDMNQLPLYPYFEIFHHAILQGISIITYLKEMETAKIKVHIKSLVDEYSDAKEKLLENIEKTKVRHNDFHTNRVFAAIANVIVLSEIEDSKLEDNEDKQREIKVYETFKRYVEFGINYISNLYHINSIRIIYKTLDDSEQKFLVLMYLAKEAAQRGDIKAALASYREAGERYPYVAGLINQLVIEYTNKISKTEIILSMDNLNLDNIVPFSNSDEFNRSTRVLQGTIEIANQMNSLVKELQHEDVLAKSLNYYPSYLGYPSDYVYDLTKWHPAFAEDLQQITSKAIETFDIFHFYFNQTLMPDYSDLPLLLNKSKKVVMHYLGSDVRRFSIAKNFNKYNVAKTHDESQIISRLEHVSKYVKNCIIADGELYEYVKDYFENVHFLNTTIDLEAYQPPIDFTFRKVKPLVVHAPTSPEIKGTRYVLEAVENLQKKYDFDFKLVKDMSHEEAKKVYKQADIIVDQLKLGSYGVLALEAMAMGKPVITYINEFMRDYYPKDLPIVSANTENVGDELEKLLVDDDLRSILGDRGRKYVEKHHNPKIVVKKLLDIYKSI
ncbi:glycosyltransferase [Paenibacillus sp. H1-7]|uniref:glycosyltransferase n=1 Tax=Paenibacillus sp. H1-7 TaxID=2282849 RepID=UPI001EF93601|nr:glycosyltransferase [Paenibacillus sp. H1-7]ULL19450.1 glycosyltransferase [Paenibacillus sp. H1-7]